MILFTAFVVAAAIVFCFALAASSSPVYGFNAKAELATRRDNSDPSGRSVAKNSNLAQVAASSRPGVPQADLPVLSAAGMQ